MTILTPRKAANNAGKEQPDTFEDIPVGELSLDPEVNRSIIATRVASIRGSLNLAAVGVLTVSKRADGTYVVLDGQHRRTALIEAGHELLPVHCHVHHGLTIDQEAALFRLLNNTRQVGSMDSFLKGVLALDPECVAINRVARQFGWTIALSDEDGTIAAVTALQSVYRRDDGVMLARVLGIITTAWKYEHKSVEGPMLRGFATFLVKNPDIDDAQLAKKLGNHGRAALIAGRARFLADGKITSGPANGVAYALAEAWNVRRHSGRAVA